jgi:putative transposase
MRISRYQALSQPSGNVHLFWKCHNSEYLFERDGAKKLFFQSLILGLKHRGSGDSVKLHAFCLMSNHVHQQMSFSNGAAKLSHVMRVAHSSFGMRFNRAFNRSGKVANERPKTPLVGDRESEMRVHFYIEANPIRAGMVKLEKLRSFFWNSYRFFAYGDVDEWTQHLTLPDWYLELGRTPQERQKNYRALFRKNLEQTIITWTQFLSYFIGTASWVRERETELKKRLEIRLVASARASPQLI